MQILFTRNNTIVSKLIRTVTGEPVSHVAIQVADCVLHSNFLGTRIEKLGDFSKHSQVQYVVVTPEDRGVGEFYRVFEALAEKRGYDFPAMFWLAARALTPKWLLQYVPKANLWNVSGLFICTELVTYILDGKPDSMITPYGLYLRLNTISGV